MWRHFVGIALASVVLLVPRLARATACNFTPSDLSNVLTAGDWVVSSSEVLCGGTYQVPGTVTVPAGTQVQLGANPSTGVGAEVVIVATRALLQGTVVGEGAGRQGGVGCTNPQTGSGGDGAVSGSGGGHGAPFSSLRSPSTGGGGGGGGGYGGNGGGGGRGSHPYVGGGAGGVSYGTTTIGPDTVTDDVKMGSGGGGGACDANGDFGMPGGRGGAAFAIVAKDIDIEPDTGAPPTVTMDGAQGAGSEGGGAGGAGSGGTIALYATEQLTIGYSGSNVALSASGGAGGSGGESGKGGIYTTAGGGGGGGAGGRIKIARPMGCTAFPDAVQGGAGGSAVAYNGATPGVAGVSGTFGCAVLDAPPVLSGVTVSRSSLNENDATGVTVTAGSVTDPYDRLIQYEFDCKGDGTYSAPQTAGSYTCLLPRAGTYHPTVRASDWNSIQITIPSSPTPPAGATPGTYAPGTFAFGGSSTASSTVTVANVPPAVSLQVSGTPDEGSTLTFTASVTDTANDTFSTHWDFGDGSNADTSSSTSTSVNEQHVFADNGSYTVGVAVTDADGATASASTPMTIANVPPTVTAGTLAPPVYATQSVLLTATATDPSAADAAAGFSYDFVVTDPTGAVTGLAVAPTSGNAGGVSVTFDPKVVGQYQVSVTATDKDGGTSAPATTSFTAIAPAPTLTLTAAPTPEVASSPAVLTVNAVWTDPLASDQSAPFSFACDFGDGTTVHDQTASPSFMQAQESHSYSQAGSYTVSFSVTNQAGFTATATLPVTVVSNCASAGCPAPDECQTQGACDSTTGLCAPNPPKSDGTSCSAGVCEKGVCTDLCSGVTCPSPDECHDPGACDASTGKCSNPAKADGAVCSAGACESGVCTDLCAGVTCPAPGECQTAGTCVPSTGKCSTPSKPDGTACSSGTCESGVCTSLCAGVTCPSPGECQTAGSCDPSTGKCSTPSKPDGTACSSGTCESGVCTSLCAGVTCPSPSECQTAGTCDPSTGKCSTPSKPDGTLCSTGACESGVCRNLCPGVTCTATNPCHEAGTCDPGTGRCSSPSKEDGTPCPSGACKGGVCTDLCAGVTCPPADACHNQSTCDSATGTCPTQSPLPDGTPCPNGACKGGACTSRCAGVTCTPSDDCHQAGVCDPTTGSCSNPVKADGSACSTGICNAGVCQGRCEGVTCSAPDSCHEAGTCDPATGQCSSRPVADGTSCPGGACRGGECVPGGSGPPGSADGGVGPPLSAAQRDVFGCDCSSGAGTGLEGLLLFAALFWWRRRRPDPTGKRGRRSRLGGGSPEPASRTRPVLASVLAGIALSLLPQAARGTDTLQSLTARATVVYNEHDYSAAAKLFEQILARADNPELYFDLGQARRLMGDPRGAIQAFDRYLQARPGAANAAKVRATLVVLSEQVSGLSKAPDTTPPRIEAWVPTSLPAGQAFALTARIRDPSGVFEPRLLYRLAGADSYQQLGMTGGPEYYTAGLPGMAPGTLEYYFEAYDDLGNGPTRRGTPSYPLRVAIVAGSSTPAVAATRNPPPRGRRSTKSAGRAGAGERQRRTTALWRIAARGQVGLASYWSGGGAVWLERALGPRFSAGAGVLVSSSFGLMLRAIWWPRGEAVRFRPWLGVEMPLLVASTLGRPACGPDAACPVWAEVGGTPAFGVGAVVGIEYPVLPQLTVGLEMPLDWFLTGPAGMKTLYAFLGPTISARL